MQKNEKLVQAHHSDPSYIEKNCHHYYCDTVSIISMIKSPDKMTPAFAHAHDEYEFMLPLTPIPVLLNNDSLYFGEVGYAYPVHSGRPHGAKFNVSDIENNHIVVDKSFMENLMKKMGCSDKEFNSRFPVSVELERYIGLFKDVFTTEDESRSLKLEHLAALICYSIIQLGLFGTEDRRKPEKTQYRRGIMSIASYMNAHFDEDITVEQLSKMNGTSKHYFIESFKKTMNDPPHTYLLKLRISKAKILLQTTDLSVKEISQSCGFKKPNSFTSLFKNTVGMTPKEYRKLWGEKD